MYIIISIVTTKKTMETKILKNVVNISRWNLKICSSNPEEDKNREGGIRNKGNRKQKSS